MCRTERRSGTCIWPHFLVCTNQLHSVQFSAFFRHPKIAIRVILAVGVLPKTPNKGWYCLDPSVLRERFFAAWGDASRPEVEGRGEVWPPLSNTLRGLYYLPMVPVHRCLMSCAVRHQQDHSGLCAKCDHPKFEGQMPPGLRLPRL